jgi:hypothetical protein
MPFTLQKNKGKYELALELEALNLSSRQQFRLEIERPLILLAIRGTNPLVVLIILYTLFSIRGSTDRLENISVWKNPEVKYRNETGYHRNL